MPPSYSDDEFGNKTYNLDILKKNLEGDIVVRGGVAYRVRVPAFVGISHSRILAFIDQHLDQSLNSKWSAIREKYFKNSTRESADGGSSSVGGSVLEDTISQLLTTKQFPGEFLKEVEQLGSSIKEIFAMHNFDCASELSTLGTGIRLMVRSTGKEDTKDLANAGGNETVVNIQPTVADVSSAMGIVVASYLGEKSLKQRLSVAKNREDIMSMLIAWFLLIRGM